MSRWLLALALLGPVAAEAAFPLVKDVATAVDNTNGTTQTIPNATDSGAGDLVIAVACFANDSTGTFTWPASTYLAGDAWTSLQSPIIDPDAQVTMGIRYGTLDAAMSGTENITSANTQSSIGVLVLRKDSFTGSPAIGTASTTGAGATSSTIDPPSASCAGDCLWIVTACGDGAVRLGLTSIDPGWELRTPTRVAPGGTNVGFLSAFHKENVASLDPSTTVVAWTVATKWIAQTIGVVGATIPAGGGSSGGKFVCGSVLGTPCGDRAFLWLIAAWLVSGAATALAWHWRRP